MGTWIYHLRIAQNLLDIWPDLEEMAFVCGNLAPDSGRPNADFTRFDPPKELTHFLQARSIRPRGADLVYYRGYLAGLNETDDPARYAFNLGYFCHLLADNLWIVQIEPASRAGNKAILASEGEAGWNTLKGDWYDLDGLYLAAHPDSLYWRFCRGIPILPPYLPFLDWESLYEQYDYMRNFYQQPPERPLDRCYRYLNATTMDRCVADSSRKIAWLVEVLKKKAPPVTDPSALALLSAEDLLPYDAPLGDLN
ncbi:MAG: zinc dependent phospholipase C family protein [Anaerolineae bacterium]